MGRSKTEERKSAAELYIASSLTQEQVAAIVKVSTTQINRWHKADNWEVQRTAKHTTAAQIILNNYALIAEMQQKALEEKRPLSPAEVDALSKMSASIDKLDKKLSIGTYHMVLEEFTKELMQIDMNAAKILSPHILAFLNKKVKQLESR